METKRYISVRGRLPGPKSQAVLQRMQHAVPRAISAYAPLVVKSAHGTLLTDLDDNVLIDLTGGIGVLNVGHTHPAVADAVHRQVDRFLHTDFTVVPYESYVHLAERLNARFPGGGPVKTAFFNSGAEAVENAIKIARSYRRRSAVVSFERAFHGRTLLTMSLTSKVHPYKAGMGPFAPEIYRLPYPYPYRCPNGKGSESHQCDETCYEPIAEAFELHVAPEDVAAVIVEPVQGEGGFVVPPPSFLPWLRKLTERHGILLICDEIQSGFGRTGKFLACEHAGIRPDLITVAKSIAGGLPLSGVMGRAEVMDSPGDSQIGGTFVGNPVAIEAAHAVLDLFDQEPWLERAAEQGRLLRQRLTDLAQVCPQIGEVRGLGAMVGVELVKDRSSKVPAPEFTDRVLRAAAQSGVLCLKAGIYGNVIRFLAPLNTEREILGEALDVLEQVIVETSRA